MKLQPNNINIVTLTRYESVSLSSEIDMLFATVSLAFKPSKKDQERGTFYFSLNNGGGKRGTFYFPLNNGMRVSTRH